MPLCCFLGWDGKDTYCILGLVTETQTPAIQQRSLHWRWWKNRTPPSLKANHWNSYGPQRPGFIPGAVNCAQDPLYPKSLFWVVYPCLTPPPLKKEGRIYNCEDMIKSLSAMSLKKNPFKKRSWRIRLLMARDVVSVPYRVLVISCSWQKKNCVSLILKPQHRLPPVSMMKTGEGPRLGMQQAEVVGSCGDRMGTLKPALQIPTSQKYICFGTCQLCITQDLQLWLTVSVTLEEQLAFTIPPCQDSYKFVSRKWRKSTLLWPLNCFACHNSWMINWC